MARKGAVMNRIGIWIFAAAIALGAAVATSSMRASAQTSAAVAPADDPSSQPYQRGRALLDEGQPRAAAEVFLSSYRTNPNGAHAQDSLYYLGQALVELGQPTQACKAYAELQSVYGGDIRSDIRPLLVKALADAGCRFSPLPVAAVQSTPAAASVTTNGSKGATANIPATAADLTVGASLRDINGLPIGVIVSVESGRAIVDTGQTKVGVPLNAFGKNGEGLLLSLTADQFTQAVANAHALARSTAPPGADSAQTSAQARPTAFDPQTAASVVAALRAPADQPFTDQQKQSLKAAGQWDHFLRRDKDVCDGRAQADGSIIESPRHACSLVALAFESASDAPDAIAYELKACKIGTDSGADSECDYAISGASTNGPHHDVSVATARAILFDCHTSGCLASLSESLAFQNPADPGGAGAYAKLGCEEASPRTMGPLLERVCRDAQRFGSLQDISAGLAESEDRNQQQDQAVADRNARFSERNAELAQETANRQAMVDSVTHNGNLIAETANQQTAQILAIGNAAARANAGPPAAMPTPATGQQIASRETLPAAGSGESNVRSSNSGNSSDTEDYAAPLDSSCVSHFWDHSLVGGGWWAFRNDCGRPIFLGFIAMNGTGGFGGSGGDIHDLAAGATHNIGQSPAEVQAAGGGYILFVCPADYIAVAANGGNLSATNTSFRCKRQ